jgi:hypothetical protein
MDIIARYKAGKITLRDLLDRQWSENLAPISAMDASAPEKYWGVYTARANA